MWSSLSVKFWRVNTYSDPPTTTSRTAMEPSSNIIPVGWGHVAEPVRLNPNQFLSNGRRKVPNRVYARLMQSACGWGKDDCAIMSSLISFRQAGRQTGRPAQRGWSWRDAHSPPGTAGWAQCQIPSLSKGFIGENTGPEPPGLKGREGKDMRRDRKLDGGKTRGTISAEVILEWKKKPIMVANRPVPT